MLKSIHIENVALIKSLDFDFSANFSAFTGETGAGKSIIIDSLGLLCGNKVSKDIIRNQENYAEVSGIFSDLGSSAIEKCTHLGLSPDEDGILQIQRNIKTDGKSVVRINGKQVSLSVLKEISPSLINIHGQHDNLELMDSEKHIKILDLYAENTELAKEYADVFLDYVKIKKELDTITVDESEKMRRIEMLRFQINDISSAKLKDGEEEELSEQRKKLLNIEKISKNSSIITEALDSGSGFSAVENISRAIEALKNLSKISDDYYEYVEALTDVKSTLIDISQSVLDFSGGEYDNPETMLDKIEARLDEISKLKRKYGADINEIISFMNKAKKELDELENFDRHSEALHKKLNACGERLKLAGINLGDSRKKAAEMLKSNIEKQLKYLDMPGVKFKVGFETKPYSKDGCDSVEFFIMTNSGEGYSPLSKTASGGELSRIMLAIKSVIAEKDNVDTLIFDEIDTGISGKTSRKIGLLLSEIAKGSQVMCVTHSAQICSLADAHYLVSKKTENNRTTTNVSLLDYASRINETARIIAGINITESALSAAKDLIENKSL